MQVKEIKSESNAIMKRLRGLQERSYRKELRLFLLEGAKLIDEALKKKIELVDVVVSHSFLERQLKNSTVHKIDEIDTLISVNDKIFKSLQTTVTTPGIIASAVQPKYDLEDCFASQNLLIVVGEQIQDPGNLGTIIRNCLAFSVDGIILTAGSADCYSPKVVRSSMGALFGMKIVQDAYISTCLEACKRHKLTTVALDAHARSPCSDISTKTSIALFFGNEGAGLSKNIVASVDMAVKIPMNSRCESLNVGVAVGIVLSSIYERRK